MATKAAKKTAEFRTHKRAEYPCRDCGHKPLDDKEGGSQNPDVQIALVCPKCGMYHEIHKSRIKG